MAEQVILAVLAKMNRRVPATKLVKLVYLTDYIYFQHFGRTMTGLRYQWDHYGPNAVGHAIIQTAEGQAREGRLEYQRQENPFGGITKYFLTCSGQDLGLDNVQEMILDDVIQRYGSLSVEEITRESKKTKPFRQAAQFDLLEMEHQFPAYSASNEDIAAHLREMEDGGTTLEQIQQRHAVRVHL